MIAHHLHLFQAVILPSFTSFYTLPHICPVGFTEESAGQNARILLLKTAHRKKREKIKKREKKRKREREKKRKRLKRVFNYEIDRSLVYSHPGLKEGRIFEAFCIFVKIKICQKSG